MPHHEAHEAAWLTRPHFHILIALLRSLIIRKQQLEIFIIIDFMHIDIC